MIVTYQTEKENKQKRDRRRNKQEIKKNENIYKDKFRDHT